MLEARGPQLPFPYSSGIEGSRHTHMRELRIQSGSEPYRVFYAFDPWRTAIRSSAASRARSLLRDVMILVADRYLYEEHLIEIRKEDWI